jgi:hypothetical protein
MWAMALEKQSHLDELQIEAYAEGSLTDAEAAQCGEHLLICEACRKRVANSDLESDALRHMAARWREPAQPAHRATWFPRLIPVLGAAALLLVIGIGLRTKGPSPVTPESVALEAVRGGGGGTVAQAGGGKPLLLHPGLQGLAAQPEFHLEIVDTTGKRAWQGNFKPEVGASAPALAPGIYFVRLFNIPGTLLREYVMEVKAKQG